MRAIIETKIKRGDVSDVTITGFLNQGEISKAYIAGDILVLPSSERETWGLVVNEGMNFGLPVIVSDRVGCAPDLVKDGENSYIVPYNSSFALANSLRKLIIDSGRRQAFGKHSLEIIRNWGLNQLVEGVVRALQRVERTR